MRDMIVTLIVFASLPYIFKKPWFGAVMWIWISVMNPHAQGWGWARSFPFAAIIAATTLLSMLISKDDKKLPITPVTVVFMLFVGWMSVTTLFAIHPDQVIDQWTKVCKIMAMTLVVLMLLRDRQQVDNVLMTVTGSIAFYGVKGGLFTIRSGGSQRVWGPEGTFIEGNNEVALAFVIAIPLIVYCMSLTENKWAKRGLMAAILLCALAALGSYSRGAAIAIAAMCCFLWLKSTQKGRFSLAILIVVPLLLMVMPRQWYDRVDTINDYQDDASAMGRINAWKMTWNLASDRFLGGGFEIYDPEVFARYAPNPLDIHAAHSIYFQVLGEHGFVGLALYLLLGVLTFRTGSWIVKHSAPYADLAWAARAARMMQVSLLGFAVGGAFLSLAYFDVPYYLMCALVATQQIVKREIAAKLAAPAATPQTVEGRYEPA